MALQNKNKKTVLYFCTGFSTFVKKDLQIIEENYHIRTFRFAPVKKWHTPFILLRQCIFLAANVRSASLVICQFAGYHSLLPVLFANWYRKPSLIISGGTDCVSFPSIHYGAFAKKYLREFTIRSYKKASCISPVHESLIHCAYTYQDADFREQGIKAFIPDIKTPMHVIYNGYDPVAWIASGTRERKRFITVLAGTKYTFSRVLKGLDLIEGVASFFPDCTFVILGTGREGQKSSATNVSYIPFMENEKLPSEFSKATYYIQLSISEGFPNALSEAMLCGCVPIVSDVGSMPDITGNCGFILTQRNVELLRALINRALSADTETLGHCARDRVMQKYSLEKRRHDLLKLLSDLQEHK